MFKPCSNTGVHAQLDAGMHKVVAVQNPQKLLVLPPSACTDWLYLVSLAWRVPVGGENIIHL